MSGRLTGLQRSQLRAKLESDPTPVFLLSVGGGLYVRDGGIRSITVDRIGWAFCLTTRKAANDARRYLTATYPEMFGSSLDLTVVRMTLGEARKLANAEKPKRR